MSKRRTKCQPFLLFPAAAPAMSFVRMQVPQTSVILCKDLVRGVTIPSAKQKLPALVILKPPRLKDLPKQSTHSKRNTGNPSTLSS